MANHLVNSMAKSASDRAHGELFVISLDTCRFESPGESRFAFGGTLYGCRLNEPSPDGTLDNPTKLTRVLAVYRFKTCTVGGRLAAGEHSG